MFQNTIPATALKVRIGVYQQQFNTIVHLIRNTSDYEST